MTGAIARIRARALVSLASAWLFAACSQPPEPARSPEVLATVGSEVLTVERFQAAMRSRGVDGDNPAAKQALLDELVDHLKLVHTAKQRGYQDDPKVVRAFENALVARLRSDGQSRQPAPVEISEAALQDHYNTHIDEFTTPARIRAAHIFVAAPASFSPEKRSEKRAKIEEARQAAAADTTGSPHFGAIAVKYSEDQPTRYHGGDLGYLVEGTTGSLFPPDVTGALFELDQPGSLSPVIETPDGFYLFKLVERNPAAPTPFKTVRPQIHARLLREQQDAAARTLTESLTASVPVTIDQSLLETIKPPATPSQQQSPTSPPPTPSGR